MGKEEIENLINEFYELNSKYTLVEIIQSILDEKNINDAGKLRLIRIKLEMEKADKEIIKILKQELNKHDKI